MKLRCPCCGHCLFCQTTFRTHLHPSVGCERFEREPSQWLGARYINLDLSCLLVVTGSLITSTCASLTMPQQFNIWIPVAALGPFLCFRLTKGLCIFLEKGLCFP
jgi:uncharacterized protein (DUF983 family)